MELTSLHFMALRILRWLLDMWDVRWLLLKIAFLPITTIKLMLWEI